jgi:hypothetical protein
MPRVRLPEQLRQMRWQTLRFQNSDHKAVHPRVQISLSTTIWEAPVNQVNLQGVDKGGFKATSTPWASLADALGSFGLLPWVGDTLERVVAGASGVFCGYGAASV